MPAKRPQVHARFVVGIQRPHVTPILRRSDRVSGNDVRLKIVGVHIDPADQPRQYILAEIV